MATRRIFINCWLLLAAASISTGVHSASSLYRYENDKDVVVVDFSIPPQFVHKGYDVLAPSGQLLRTVPPVDPSMTQELIEKRRRQQEEDNFIVRSYSSLDDIERARSRKMDMVEKEILILETNLEDFDSRRIQLREQAANYQASGQDAPGNVEKTLGDLDVHEKNTRQLLEERRREKSEIDERYNRYGQRLLALRPAIAQQEAAKALQEAVKARQAAEEAEQDASLQEEEAATAETITTQTTTTEEAPSQ